MDECSECNVLNVAMMVPKICFPYTLTFANIEASVAIMANSSTKTKRIQDYLLQNGFIEIFVQSRFIAINRKKQENGKKLKLLSILIHLVMLVPLRLALKGTMRYWRFFISVLVIFFLLRYNIANLFWSDPYGEKHHQLGRHR